MQNKALPLLLFAVRSPARWRPGARAALFAFGVTGFLLLTKLGMGDGSLRARYQNLRLWDGGWYYSVTFGRYEPPVPGAKNGESNTVFYPGYPLAARLVHRLLPALDGWTVLLVTAQLGCFVLFWYWFLLIEEWQVEAGAALAALLLLVTFPSAFYLVAAYSEPLFLMHCLGVIYWMDKDSRLATPFAAGHALAGAATRLVGVGLLPLILFWAVARRKPGGSVLRGAAILLAALVGSVALHVYFGYRFHELGLYFRGQQVGWFTVPQFGFLLDWETYTLAGKTLPLMISALVLPLWLIALAGLLLLEWTERGEIREARGIFYRRAGLYSASAVMAFLGGTGVVHARTRYFLPPWVFLLLGAQLRRRPLSASQWRLLGGLVLTMVILIGWLMQGALYDLFIRADLGG